MHPAIAEASASCANRKAIALLIRMTTPGLLPHSSCQYRQTLKPGSKFLPHRAQVIASFAQSSTARLAVAFPRFPFCLVCFKARSSDKRSRLADTNFRSTSPFVNQCRFLIVGVLIVGGAMPGRNRGRAQQRMTTSEETKRERTGNAPGPTVPLQAMRFSWNRMRHRSSTPARSRMSSS